MVVVSTPQAVKLAQEFRDKFAFEQAFARLTDDMNRFVRGEIIGVVSLNAAAQAMFNRAVMAQSRPGDPATYDWQCWRLGLEYAALALRTRSPIQLTNWVGISGALEVAYGNWALGYEKEARLNLQSIRGPIASLPGQVLKKSPDATPLAAIGRFFKDVLGVLPNHPAFEPGALSLNTDSLIQAIERRIIYADATHAGGAILPGPIGDFIPLEVIYLNHLLEIDQQDKTMSFMLQKMAATTYPDDPLFAELDTIATLGGY